MPKGQATKQLQQKKNKSTLAIESKGRNPSSPQHSQQLTRQQIQSVFLSAAIPMVGFGFMDNFIMITAGSAIDNSLGVQMGLATMTAAAIGQVVSDVSGVIFGDTMSRVFQVSPARLTKEQRKLAVVGRLRLGGAVLGVIAGCALGATALYLIPDRAREEATDDPVPSLSSSSQQQQQQERIREQLHRLQQVLDDVMTNKEDKWCDRRASCTLYVNDSMAGCIPEAVRRGGSFFGFNVGGGVRRNSEKTATIERMGGGGNNNNSNDDPAILQAASEARVVVFANTIYVPVVEESTGENKNTKKTILGILKVKLENGSFYSGSEIKDAKRVARNLGFFLNHMV